jgi:hypothetical protein
MGEGAQPVINDIRLLLTTYRSRLLRSSLAQVVAPEIPVAESIDDAIRQLDPSQQWIVQDVTMSPDQGATLAQAIIDGDAIAVSDGSFKDEYGELYVGKMTRFL